MKISVAKLDLALARKCMVDSDLRSVTSHFTLSRIRRGEDVKPSTVGIIARALEIDPAELVARPAE